MKKYTEQDIINKFQDFDFDPKGVNKQAVYNKVKQGKAKSAKLKYFGLGLTAVAACVLVFMVIPKQGIISDDFSSKPVEESLIAQSSAPAAVVANSNDLSKAMVAYKAAGSLSSAKTTWGPSAVQAPNIALMRNSSMGISAAPIAGRGMSYQPPMPVIIVASQPSYNNMDDEKYTEFKQNRFKLAAAEPLSTFSADVDTASYTIVKRYIEQGQIPPAEAVRAEEFINYFSYNYPAPKDDKPVNIITQYAPAPWNDSHKLLKIGVKAKDITEENLPRANLVFLIDISGSMEEENRLPLIKKSLKMLVEKLRPSDMVSIVTYAGGTNIRLDGVKAKDKQKIRDVIDSLYASGSTNGSSGLTMAYKVAKSNFIKNGNNRVILATDGDFNVGPTSSKEMEAQITEARKSDVFLSVIGVGMGNYKDERIQLLANKGNGNYAYINDLFDAQKVFVKEFGATMFTVAKDVKFQVEFNPSQVAAYRLIGYEKRALNNEDFNDDTKDAGELGAG
ncbi:MAG: VWA domain-containing protein, partial [Elusimicrobium sp.]|nr:VWA domain-containing protein [Elusimicrobium sp.]